VDEAISESAPGPVFLERLKGTEATPDEVCNYIKQFTQQRTSQGASTSNSGNVGGSQPPAQADAGSPNLVDTAISIAWALLCEKVEHFRLNSSQVAAPPGSSLSDKLASLLGLLSAKSAIPASVLAKAPHLAKLCDPSTTNSHIKKTQDLLSVYSPQNSQDILVNKAQFAPVNNPLLCTIWWKILLDVFVNFEKPFASMDKEYDHHDNLKDFGAGYALVKKDQAFSKWPLQAEAN
jgi:hypothetical protein